jgi:glycosyltransferase involved in cell wall biosynthesis
MERAIDSVTRQTHRDIELVICDDGSATPIEAVLFDYLQEVSRSMSVKVVRNQSNLGISAARNKAIERSEGKWLTFVDGDDYIADNCIEQLIASAKHSQCVIGDCLVISDTVFAKRSPSALAEEALQWHKTEKDPFLLNVTSLQPMLLMRDVVEQIGAFDSTFRFAELTEIFLRYLYYYGVSGLSFAPSAHYFYLRDRLSSVSHNRTELFAHRLKALNMYMKKSGISGILSYKGRNKQTGFQEYSLNP